MEWVLEQAATEGRSERLIPKIRASNCPQPVSKKVLNIRVNTNVLSTQTLQIYKIFLEYLSAYETGDYRVWRWITERFFVYTFKFDTKSNKSRLSSPKLVRIFTHNSSFGIMRKRYYIRFKRAISIFASFKAVWQEIIWDSFSANSFCKWFMRTSKLLMMLLWRSTIS